MQAVILVGGEGTRLRPLTYDIPKPMVPIFGKSYLEHLIDHLKKYQVTEVILSSGYKFPEFKKYFKDGRDIGINIYYAEEASPLGTAGAAKNAEKFIKDKFLVFNGDVLSDINLSELLGAHQRNNSIATLSLYRVDDPSSYGLVKTGHNERIESFIEKPSKEEITTDYVNAGIYLLEREVLDFIPPGENHSFERQLFPYLLKENLGVYAYKFNTYWIDIGSPEKYFKIHRDVLDKKIKLNIGKPNHGDIFLGKGVKIDSAKLIPPVFIDDGCILEQGVVLGPMAVIGKGSRIKKDASISDSLTWENTVISEGVKVKDSIIGRNCVISKRCLNQVIGSDTIF